jgi:hypothetical protein
MYAPVVVLLDLYLFNVYLLIKAIILSGSVSYSGAIRVSRSFNPSSATVAEAQVRVVEPLANEAAPTPEAQSIPVIAPPQLITPSSILAALELPIPSTISWYALSVVRTQLLNSSVS